MRQWLVGQTSGGENRKEAGDEIKNINNNACKTKNRKCTAKWLTGREWFVFDHENVSMFCKECHMYAKENKANNFVVGTNNFKVRAVNDHEKNLASANSD